MNKSLHDDIISFNVSSDPILKAQLANIRDNIENLIEPPFPSAPLLNPTMSMKRKIHKIQQYINKFEYNYTGESYFSLRKDKGMKHLVYTAKCMMREPYPIQCVEAVFLGVHLTNSIKDLLRIPISFKTQLNGHEHSHIILAIQHKKKWGAIGISRIDTLMGKSLTHASLAELVDEFIISYGRCYHEVIYISVGLPFSHNDISESPLKWKILNLSINERAWHEVKSILTQYAKKCEALREYFGLKGRLPDMFLKQNYKTGSTKRTILTKNQSIII